MAYDLRDTYYLIGFTSNQIVSCGLPTKQQVLAVLFYNLRTVGIKELLEKSANINSRKEKMC